MSIINSFFLIVFLSLSLAVFAQKKQKEEIKYLIVEINKSSKTGLATDSFLLALQKKNDLVVAYSTFNTTWQHVPRQYFIQVFNKNNSKAYKYIVHRHTLVGEKPYQIESVTMSKTDADSVIGAFKANQSWTQNYEENDNTALFCDSLKYNGSCLLSDASYQSILIMTKTHLNSSTFYDPEYFEKCCPGNRRRQLFLATIKPISDFFSRHK